MGAYVVGVAEVLDMVEECAVSEVGQPGYLPQPDDCEASLAQVSNGHRHQAVVY